MATVCGGGGVYKREIAVQKGGDQLGVISWVGDVAWSVWMMRSIYQSRKVTGKIWS